MARSRSQRMPALPELLKRKLYKTGQTRGADDDEIYQNRVLRNSTVLIPYPSWEICATPSRDEARYENGFIVLVPPETYFSTRYIDVDLRAKGLEIGRNALVFYEKREHWNAHNPESLGWVPATQRLAPLGGQYVARVAATTSAAEGGRLNRGFTTTSMKGAGIRVYEYASSPVIERCRSQLEGLFWLCADADEAMQENGMSAYDRNIRRELVMERCQEQGLLDMDRLKAARTVDSGGRTICPLCLELLSAKGFVSRMEQAEGREVHDLTITQVSLFHINELRYGVVNHSPYNVAWGHHHCNVVVKDAGILETLKWLKELIDRNVREGLFPS
jgi:hypothetical protein